MPLAESAFRRETSANPASANLHRVRHEHALNGLRYGAALLLLTLCLTGAALAALILGFWLQNKRLLVSALGLLGIVGLSGAIFRLVANSARCPLCFCPVLLPKREPCHRNSSSLLGSHRIRVMTDILAHGEFRCPYCNEPTRCELKASDQRPRS